MDLLFFAVFSEHFVLIKIRKKRKKSAHESASIRKNNLMSENKQQTKALFLGKNI